MTEIAVVKIDIWDQKLLKSEVRKENNFAVLLVLEGKAKGGKGAKL